MRPGKLLVLILLLVFASSRLHATVRYTVRLADPERHLIRVAMELPPGTRSRELQLPVWNALYQVRDFVQFMDKIAATNAEGKPLAITQLNKSRWRLEDAENGATVEYEMFSNDPGPFGTEANGSHVFLNLAQVLIYSDDTRQDEIELKFTNIPANWKVATALQQHGASFLAKDYDTLVDSPVEISVFQERDFNGTCGQYRVVVDATKASAILDKIVPLIQRVVNAATEWMNDCPFQTYTFIYHFTDSPNNGGMEHAFSTAIAMPEREIDDPERFTAVTAHEFFHLWDVKRIRPRSLEPVDYTREDYTDALWFSEGTDTACADSIRLHAGLMDERHYLDHLSQAITELQNRPAHLTQSAVQSSMDAWLEKYFYYGLPDRSISYYNKGELLGVLLDLKLREASHGKQSLQMLFRWMNDHYARQGKFFADTEGVREVAEQLSGRDLHEFFTDYVSGVREIPWDTFFSGVGLQVSKVEAKLAHRGFDVVHKFDQPATVVRVQSGSEADRAGLKPNDVIVSINGTPAVNVERQIEALGPGTVLKLRIRREGVQQDFQWTLTVRKVDVWHLQDAPSVTAEQKAARAAWLFGRATN